MNPMNEISGPITSLELEGRTVVIRANRLRPEFADKDRRFVCECGYGCKPFLIGRAVFGRFLIDGEECRVDRGDIEGIAVHQATAAHSER